MIPNLLSVRELTYDAILLRTLTSIVLGGIIGMERGMKHRAAGLRTYMLVCLGACIVMQTNHYVFQFYQTSDPVRMGAQVINGIGFLGAGTIVVTSRNQIRGLTTAAGLWASACVGLAVGIGLYEVAVLGSVVMFLVLTLLHELDNRMRRKTKQVDVYVELCEGFTIRDFLEYVRSHELNPSSIYMQQKSLGVPGLVAFNVTLKLEKRKPHADIIHMLQMLDGVSYVEEL